MTDTERLARVLARIDAANAADPGMVEGRPAALVYGERMSAELARFCPDASEHLQIAVRGQHIERWTLPRADFPEGREGYLDWRRTQASRHAERVSGLMAEAGYPEDDRERVATLLRKTGIKRDAEVQTLEDVACLVFLRWYFADFSADKAPDAVFRIVAKTARKMSEAGRAEVAAMSLPAELLPALEG